MFIFCSDPLSPRKPDNIFFNENHSRLLKENYGVVDHDLVEKHNLSAFKYLKQQDTIVDSVYIGWMLTKENYCFLYNSLLSKGYKLINDPEQYAFCHYWRNSYDMVTELYSCVPKTIFIDFENIQDDNHIIDELSKSGLKSLIIKDWVKSQSGYWKEACFLENIESVEQSLKIIDNFRKLQGDDLYGGLVFKEYKNLIPSKKDGKPKEWRLFVLKGEIISVFCRNDDGEQKIFKPTKEIVSLAKALPSNFFSLDFCIDENGNYILIETGDGQVSNNQNLENVIQKVIK